MDFQRIQRFPADKEQMALSVPLKPYDGAELLKVILIDSVVPGRIVEMPISGGTVLTGKNGSGKTTFLQLIIDRILSDKSLFQIEKWPHL